MSDVYYTPAEYGLTSAGEIDFSSGSYEFDITAVWRDASGQLYYADDSGCSCPSPFEGFRSLDDLTKATVTELQEHLEARNGDDNGAYGFDRTGEIVDLIGRLVGA